MKSSDQLSGYIERIVYKEPEKGFTVARLQEKGKKELTTVVGYLPSVQEGESISCSGVWKFHSHYGRQFEVTDVTIESPTDLVGVRKYLESGLIKGIGPIYAQKIIDKFQEDTLKIIDETPHRLLEVPGIGEKRIEQVKDCWQEQKSIRQVMIFLQSHNVSTGYAQKIYKRYQNNAIEKVKANPYALAKEISGIGFKSADKIAASLGYDKNSPKRISAGLEYLLWELTSEGHTCYPQDLLIEKAEEALEVSKDAVEQSISSMLAKRELIQEEQSSQNFLWLQTFYTYEKTIAEEIHRLQSAAIAFREIQEEKAISWVEELLGIHFADKQKDALIAAIQQKVHIITGGPGTGKSTITQGILTILEKVTPNILLCAPTGRAAKRLNEITRKKAHTIHSLLEFDFQTGAFKKNHNNPLECDLIIIDESSMIDTYLLYSLLLALPDSAKVLFIGDIDQLPSVGPGHILKDLIFSDVISVTRLDEIFRQAKGSNITVNAHKINHGEFPILTQKPFSDFHFYDVQTPEEIITKIIDLVQTDLPKRLHLDPIKDIQILSPMRKGLIGTIHLNQLLQQSLNPSDMPFHIEGKTYHIHDKVIQLKNDYNKKVYNGDIGKIEQIHKTDQIMVINFEGQQVEYEFSELDQIALAYAISVHKYQGSESKAIVMPIHTSHFILLYRNLLYTAVTRGKKFVGLIGTKKAVAIAVKNEKMIQRYTGLQKALHEASNDRFLC